MCLNHYYNVGKLNSRDSKHVQTQSKKPNQRNRKDTTLICQPLVSFCKKYDPSFLNHDSIRDLVAAENLH